MTGSRLRVRKAVALACAGVLMCTPISAWPDDDPHGAVAVVVHTGVPADALTIDQLRQIFLAEQQYWPDKSRIVLLVRAATAYETDLVLNRIYRMDEHQFRQYWIAKMFRAEVPSGPKIVLSTNMARELVSAIPGSITFMRADDVGTGMKVLRIDGKLPTEPGYPLR